MTHFPPEGSLYYYASDDEDEDVERLKPAPAPELEMSGQPYAPELEMPGQPGAQQSEVQTPAPELEMSVQPGAPQSEVMAAAAAPPPTAEAPPQQAPPRRLTYILVKMGALCGTKGEIIVDPGTGKPFIASKAADCAALAQGGNRDPNAPAGGWKAFAFGKPGSSVDRQCMIMKFFPMDVTTEVEHQALFSAWESQQPEERQCPKGWEVSEDWDFFAIGLSQGSPVHMAAF